MTENEAKGWLEYIGNMNLPYDRSPKNRKLACDTAIHALEEIQQYREIGTVEGYENAIKAYTETYILMKEYKSKLQDFEAIGTIEEFKDLKEKKNFLPIATITFSKERLQEIVDEKIGEIELDIQKIRAKAIDEFAERLKTESYNGYATLEDYCEDTIESVAVEDIVKIAEQLKAGGKNE